MPIYSLQWHIYSRLLPVFKWIDIFKNWWVLRVLYIFKSFVRYMVRKYFSQSIGSLFIFLTGFFTERCFSNLNKVRLITILIFLIVLLESSLRSFYLPLGLKSFFYVFFKKFFCTCLYKVWDLHQGSLCCFFWWLSLLTKVFFILISVIVFIMNGCWTL